MLTINTEAYEDSINGHFEDGHEAVNDQECYHSCENCWDCSAVDLLKENKKNIKTNLNEYGFFKTVNENSHRHKCVTQDSSEYSNEDSSDNHDNVTKLIECNNINEILLQQLNCTFSRCNHVSSFQCNNDISIAKKEFKQFLKHVQQSLEDRGEDSCKWTVRSFCVVLKV